MLKLRIFIPNESKTLPCWGTHPRWCRHRSPPRTRRDFGLFVQVPFHGGLHPMNDMLREPVVEWDGPHRQLWCSCIETPVIEHSSDPLQKKMNGNKLIQWCIRMEYGNRNHAYLSKSIERVVGRGRVRRVTQCVTGLICEPSKFRRLYNNSHN
jgi:hypothetical protein